MSTEETVSVPDDVSQPSSKKSSPSKGFFREKVWDHLEKTRLAAFPHPIFGRIPNFKGADEAAAKLLELDEFKAAKKIEVNPDKVLEAARVLVVDADKVLYVPVPKLHEGFLKRISFCREDKPQNVRQCVSRWGIELLGKDVHFDEDLHIDLLVLGSVAVSKGGHRIGKGRGYADLEYAILKEMNAVNEETIIVTTVHDSQVFDSLPTELFDKHDVPIDYIVTPTQIIKIDQKLQRPERIYWNMITQKNLEEMPILLKIKELHTSKGIDTTLKQTADVELEKPLPKRRPQVFEKHFDKRRLHNQRRINNGRYFYKTRYPEVPKEVEEAKPEKSEALPLRRQNRLPNRRNGRKVDYSLIVSNINKNVRLRQLKDALIDNGIRPSNITWRGYRGFCYLHYAKSLKKEDDAVIEQKPMGVDSVIEILQKLKLTPESASHLKVKVMQPTRIETTADVTAV